MNTKDLYLEIINNLCDGVYFVDLDAVSPFGTKLLRKSRAMLPKRLLAISAKAIF